MKEKILLRIIGIFILAGLFLFTLLELYRYNTMQPLKNQSTTEIKNIIIYDCGDHFVRGVDGSNSSLAKEWNMSKTVLAPVFHYWIIRSKYFNSSDSQIRSWIYIGDVGVGLDDNCTELLKYRGNFE